MEAFLGQIIMVPYDYPPRRWAFCDGQLLPIMQNTALFSLIGTKFGGDGRTTFALPDLRGRVPVHAGASQGPGRSHYEVGQTGGEEQVSLEPKRIGAEMLGAKTPPAGQETFLLSVTHKSQGEHQPLDLRQPFAALHFIICIDGIYPSRT